jgi:hypothetical protein
MRESGWLIENRDESSPRWLAVDCGVFDWTNDSLKAIRFCRREDADQIAEVVGEDADSITEHAWGDSRDELSEPRISDLTLLVGRLVQQVRKHDSSNPVAEKAMDYLRRKNLSASILREATPKANEPVLVKIIETARLQIAAKELYDADLTLQLALQEIR